LRGARDSKVEEGTYLMERGDGVTSGESLDDLRLLIRLSLIHQISSGFINGFLAYAPIRPCLHPPFGPLGSIAEPLKFGLRRENNRVNCYQTCSCS
jgi:hypothetical protein